MATTAEKRAWAAGNGWPELAGGKGKLPAGVTAAYESAHADYAPGASEADFVAADDLDPYPDDEDGGAAVHATIDAARAAGTLQQTEPPPAEQRPQRPKPARPRLPWHRRRAAAQPKPARVRKTFRRVSLAPMVEETYTDLASMVPATPLLAPLRRLLYAQAPVAGVILDPAVKDTFVDRVALQPMARNYDRGKVGLALFGTPMTLMAVMATAPRPVFEDGQMAMEVLTNAAGEVELDESGAQVLVPRIEPPTVRHASALLGLRYCVRAMADLSGDALKRVQERAAENEAREDAVDEFIAYLLGQPIGRGADETVRQEGSQAGLKLAGATIGE